MKIAVLGGGHGGYAAAAEMAERGHHVSFWRRDAASMAPLLTSKVITLTDYRGQRDVTIARPTLSLAEAVSGAELIIVPLPATAHSALAAAIAPYLTDGQLLFFPPGTLGTLVFARAARDSGNTSDISYAETGTLPYLVRKHGAAAISISAYAKHLPTGIFPARNSARAFAILKTAYPAVTPLTDVISGALMNAGPIIHPPLILMNAGALEHFASWDIHNEGTQPSIRRVTDALDRERIKVRMALGYSAPHFPLSDHYASEGDEWMYGRSAHDRLTDSGDWREKIDLRTHRYMVEDTALGLSLLVSLGRWAGEPTPIANGLLAVGSAVIGEDLYRSGRTLDTLGIGGLTRAQMKAFLADGY